MVKIWFEDIEWENDKGDMIPMHYGQEIVIGSRLIYEYRQPVITNDTFGGTTFPVQQNIWEGYSIKFSSKELSIEHLAKLQICKKIIVQDLDTNEIIEVDTTSDGQLTIEPGEKMGTVEQIFVMKFSSCKIKNYPSISRLNRYPITIIINSIPYTYYTDIAPISIVYDIESTTINRNDGQNLTVKSIQKKGYKAVYYLMESNAILLKQYVEIAAISDILFNYSIVPLESVGCTLNEMAEGLYKCEINIIDSITPNYY